LAQESKYNGGKILIGYVGNLVDINSYFRVFRSILWLPNS